MIVESAIAHAMEWATLEPENSLLFLGAGVSMPQPAGAPLFGEVRTACAERLGIHAKSWAPDDPRNKLLQHVVPEVFLSGLSAAGPTLNQALAGMVAGGPQAKPNSVHRAVAEFVARGGTVWTTNWDLFVETSAGAMLPAGRFRKVHGDAAEPGSLKFRPGTVIRPLDDASSVELIEAASSKTVVIAGYGGADVDLFLALRAALEAASEVVWLEGAPRATPTSAPDYSLAEYEAWRFHLDFERGPLALRATTGKRVVWCGDGGNELGPSNALLRLLGSGEPACQDTDWEDRYQRAFSCLARPAGELGAGRRALVRAGLEDRLGMRTASMLHFTQALTGGSLERRVAIKALVRRVSPVVAGFRKVARQVQRLLSTAADPSVPDPLREGAELDSRLAAAGMTRWTTDLRLALEGSRLALDEAMQKNLDDPERNWVERVARASFEQANALLWQGRYEAADEVCRSGYMRLTGPKWVAWELSIRASAASLRKDHTLAERLASLALEINSLEHNQENRLALLIGRCQVRRLAGDLNGAEQDLVQARKALRGHSLLASLFQLEQAEIESLRGKPPIDAYRRLRSSRMPLVAAAASLRVGEYDASADDLRTAASLFQATGCLWGIARSDAHSGRAWDAEEIADQGLAVEMCQPMGLVVI